MEATLETLITQALRRSAAPMRALDIVRALAAEGRASDKAAVNKALYRGPFDKRGGAGAPAWTAREPPPAAAGSREDHFVFQVDAVGIFCLCDDLPRESVNALLVAALGLVPEGATAVVRPDGSAGGKVVAELAEARATIEPLVP